MSLTIGVHDCLVHGNITIEMLMIIYYISSFSGIILGPLSRRFGCRAVGLVGSVFNLAGFALCFFAPNVPFLFFSYGFLTGTINKYPDAKGSHFSF